MKSIKDRLSKVIKNDTANNFRHLSNILSSELYTVLVNYFDMTYGNINTNISISNDGNFIVDISAIASRVKMPKIGQM